MAMDNRDIALFSEEERRDIAAQIETASARPALEPPGLPARGEAVRRGLFPLAVNVAAALVLAAGLVCITAFHRGEQAEIRDSGAALGLTERRLIQEIRNETNQLMREKEAAITAMDEKITGIDAELARLDSLEALTDEQRAEMAELRARQDEYRLSLAGLQNERARILSEARQKEAALYVKLEEQQDALETLSLQSREEVRSAREELERLSGEQEKAALIEKQLNAYFAATGRQFQAGQYAEAADTAAAAREFLSTPSFQTIRSIQARRESDLAVAAALGAAAEAALRSGGQAIPASPPVPAVPPPAAGQGEAADLREALSAQNAALAELRTKNAEAQRTLTERERQIDSLRVQNTAYAQTIDTQQKTIATLNAELEKR